MSKSTEAFIAYEIRERLTDTWLQPAKAKGRGRLVGLQFEFRDPSKKKRPLLSYLRVRQVYQDAKSTRLTLVKVAKDKVRRSGHVYAAGTPDPIPNKDLPKKHLYERLQYCGRDVPDFAFFTTDELTYLAERYGQVFLSGTKATFGASFGREDLPKSAPSLKLEGGERLDRTAVKSRSGSAAAGTPAPEAAFALGVVCPPRWYFE